MKVEKNNHGPLRKLRVLDLGTLIAAPVAATLMAEFGAEVIKVEQPITGDTLRGLGPFLEDESLWWNVEGRGKKSITLNLREKQGQELLKKLVVNIDVIVENFRPGTLDSWGLGYSELAKINPKLVMLSVSGFGQDGPYSQRAGYDRIALSFSGVMGLTGYADLPPVRVGVSIADYSAATLGAFAVMMALYHRDIDGGNGQHIDLGLYEAMFRFTDSMCPSYDRLGLIRERCGNVFQAAAPGNNFPTKDGRFLTMTISGDLLFKRLCLAMNREDMAIDAQYATHRLRWENIEKLNEITGRWIAENEISYITDALNNHGVPFSIVLTVEDIFKDPHYAARQNIITIEHPKLGPLKMQSVVPKMSRTPGNLPSAAPALGADNENIYIQMLGLSRAEFELLRDQGII